MEEPIYFENLNRDLKVAAVGGWFAIGGFIGAGIIAIVMLII